MSLEQEYEEEEEMPPTPELDREITMISELDEEVLEYTGAPIDLKELCELVSNGYEEINTLKGKDVVLIIGKTGVGKSSLIQMIHGVKLHRSSGERSYQPLNPENLLNEFKIGDQQLSQTKSVRSYHVNSSKPFVICDMPGYKDTDSKCIDIATSIWINRIAEVCNTLRFVFMIHGATLEEDKGGLFRELMELLTNLMRNDPKKIGRGMLFLFTHMSDRDEEERDEESVLKYINQKIISISKAKNHNQNHLMTLLRTFIVKKTGHLRVLNPVTTNISELVEFIQLKVVPMKNAEKLVQCSFPRDALMAVEFATSHLETKIRSGFISSTIKKKEEKEEKDLSEIVSLYCQVILTLQNNPLKDSANRLFSELIEEYDSCKKNVMAIVDSTVSNKPAGDKIGKEEVQLIIPMYNKLKLLNNIFYPEEKKYYHEFLENQLGEGVDKKIQENDISSINLEFYRKTLLMKIDIAGKIIFSPDYTVVFQQFHNLLALSCLNENIGK